MIIKQSDVMAMHPYSKICEGEYTPHVVLENVFIKDNMIFDSGGTEVKESHYMVNGKKKYHRNVAIDKENPDIKLDSAYFINYFFGYHWGHFITETLSRCGELLNGDVEDQLIVNHAQYRFEGAQFGVYPTEKDETFLSLPEDTIHIEEGYSPLIYVKKLKLALPAFDLHNTIHKEHRDIALKYRELATNGREGTARVNRVLLRREIDVGRVNEINGEDFYERIEDEWDEVDFAEYPLEDQISILENADIICGVSGSSFHNLIFCKKFPNKIVYLQQDKKSTFELAFALQDLMLGLDDRVTVIDCLDVDNKVEPPIRVFYDIDKTVKELKSVE